MYVCVLPHLRRSTVYVRVCIRDIVCVCVLPYLRRSTVCVHMCVRMCVLACICLI